MKIAIVNFSGRNNAGNCSRISEYLREKLTYDNDVLVIKYSDYDIKSCSKCDYSCLNPNCHRCNNLDETNLVYNLIGKSDLVFFLLPIYSNYPCSNFFIFKERSQSVIGNIMTNYNNTKKSFIFIANTGLNNLINIVNDESNAFNDFLILSTQAYKTKGFYGDLIDKKECIEKIDDYVKNVCNVLKNTKE